MLDVQTRGFFSLTPNTILDCVEQALDSKQTGVRATGRCMALNSMENRVYEIELDNNSSVIAKFYRPGRWSAESILEEHSFLEDLSKAEVPAVAPIQLAGNKLQGSTLSSLTIGDSETNIFFAIFPKVRARILQELNDEQLAQVGRFLARLHNVGTSKKAIYRLPLNTETYGRKSLELLEHVIDPKLKTYYFDLATRLLEKIEPQLKNVPMFRIHGDCHLGNVLWHSTGPFFIDFDDMVNGPAVQDIWMIIRGRDEEALRQRNVLLTAYEQMRAFDRDTLSLIEPLRTLRLLHYAAWISKRWEDPSFKKTFPDFGTYRFWQEEIESLEEQNELT